MHDWMRVWNKVCVVVTSELGGSFFSWHMEVITENWEIPKCWVCGVVQHLFGIALSWMRRGVQNKTPINLAGIRAWKRVWRRTLGSECRQVPTEDIVKYFSSPCRVVVLINSSCYCNYQITCTSLVQTGQFDLLAGFS